MGLVHINDMMKLGSSQEKSTGCYKWVGRLLVHIKLMRLGVTNQIVVIESNLKAQFDCQFRSDSKSNEEIKSTIAILIKI